MEKRNNMEEQHDLAKWLAGEMNETEMAAFQSTLGYQTYRRIAEYSAELEVPEFNEDAVMANVMSGRKTVKTIPLYRTTLLRVAAVLVLALGLFFVFKPKNNVNAIAANGKTQTVLLPDNSRVTLNSGSSVDYNKSNWSDNRSLNLKGEAFFKVAHGKKFDVKTELGIVTVVGTQFDVKARGKRFEVECFEGKVRVRNNAGEILLQKGQLAIFENGKRIPAEASTSHLPGWMLGELRFISTPLNEVIAELERRYDVKIECSVPGSELTGSLPADNLDKALKQLCTTYNLNAKTEHDAIVLTANE